jgi:hypothetical protein
LGAGDVGLLDRLRKWGLRCCQNGPLPKIKDAIMREAELAARSSPTLGRLPKNSLQSGLKAIVAVAAVGDQRASFAAPEGMLQLRPPVGQRLIFDLFSCSLSRDLGAIICSVMAEEVGSKVRTAGDRTRRRRFNKLSCAGWIPHDRGSVLGLPRSRDEHRSGDRLITGREDSPPWSCLRQCTRLDVICSASPFTVPLD